MQTIGPLYETVPVIRTPSPFMDQTRSNSNKFFYYETKYISDFIVYFFEKNFYSSINAPQALLFTI